MHHLTAPALTSTAPRVHSRPPWLPAPVGMPLGERDDTLAKDFDRLNDTYDEVRAWLGERYRSFSAGGTRDVFDAGAVVYKIDGSGMGCSDEELACYEDRDGRSRGVPVAPCRMVYHASGLGILIMQTVRPIRDWEELPHWAFLIDSAQVGYTPYGEAVAFDVGSRPAKRVCPSQLEGDGRDDTARFLLNHDLPQRFAARDMAAA